MKNWLLFNESLISNYKKLDLNDFFDNGRYSDSLIDKLTNLITTSRRNPEILDDLTDVLGWEKVSTIIKRRQPTKDNIKKGDFGESLTEFILQNYFDYRIPVKKLRFKITRDESLHGADIIAIKHDEKELLEICYSESKLRTGRDTSTAVTAYDQLKNEYDTDMPIIIEFILEILHNKDAFLYRIFLNYLKDRRIMYDKERFVIGLIYDKMNWSFTTIDNLEESADNNYPITVVNMIRINNLAKLIDFLYNLIGDD